MEPHGTVNYESSLWKYIDSLPVIDTHEHIASEAELIGRKVDIFNLFTPYIVDNLQSAGMPEREIQMLGDSKVSFDEKWNTFGKYYHTIKNTTYFKALLRAMQFQYGMRTVSPAEFRRVSEILSAEYAGKGFMKKTMDLNRIESILTYRQASLSEVRKSYGDNSIFVVPTMNDITMKDSASLKLFSRIMEMKISTLDDILAGIEKIFMEYEKLGIRNIKFGSAYNRRLNYTRRSREDAESAFIKLLEGVPDDRNPVEKRFLSETQIILDDYLTLFMISRAEKYDMNVIFHMGLAAWNYNTVRNSHASDLEWLIQSYPRVRFVILHAGYPFFEEAILLARYYPNVYINMTWDHIIERDRSIEAMKSYIEMLPLNKIHLFGGDYIYPQQISGNMIFTRENLYIALNDLIIRGRITETDAKSIACDWLYRNPKLFYFRGSR